MKDILQKLLEVNKDIVYEACNAKTQSEQEHFAKALSGIGLAFNNLIWIESIRNQIKGSKK